MMTTSRMSYHDLRSILRLLLGLRIFSGCALVVETSLKEVSSLQTCYHCEQHADLTFRKLHIILNGNVIITIIIIIIIFLIILATYFEWKCYYYCCCGVVYANKQVLN
jgi:hypothetical protein